MDFSLDALEYYRLKDLLDRYLSTDAGRFALDELAPMLDEQKLEAEHTITAEAMLNGASFCLYRKSNFNCPR